MIKSLYIFQQSHHTFTASARKRSSFSTEKTYPGDQWPRQEIINFRGSHFRRTSRRTSVFTIIICVSTLMLPFSRRDTVRGNRCRRTRPRVVSRHPVNSPSSAISPRPTSRASSKSLRIGLIGRGDHSNRCAITSTDHCRARLGRREANH